MLHPLSRIKDAMSALQSPSSSSSAPRRPYGSAKRQRQPTKESAHPNVDTYKKERVDDDAEPFSLSDRHRSRSSIPSTLPRSIGKPSPSAEILSQAATAPSRSVSGAGHTSLDTVSSTTATAAAAVAYVISSDDEGSLLSSDDLDTLTFTCHSFGSPLYDPVKDCFLCWNRHKLDRKPRTAYGAVDGVSCDFCGDTDWIEAPPGLASAGPSSSAAAEALGVVSIAEEDHFLFHCDVCDVDLCLRCLAEVRQDERFHVPCLQCRSCHRFETRHGATLHRCSGERSVKQEEEKKTGSCPPMDSMQPSDMLPALFTVDSVLLPSSALPYPGTDGLITKSANGLPKGRRVRLGMTRPSPAITASAEEQKLSPVAARRQNASPAASRSATRRRPGRRKNQDDTATELPLLSPRESIELPISTSLVLQSPGHSARKWEVEVVPQTSSDVAEIERLLYRLQLVVPLTLAPGKPAVLYFQTRLAAEACSARVAEASITAVLRRCQG